MEFLNTTEGILIIAGVGLMLFFAIIYFAISEGTKKILNESEKQTELLKKIADKWN